MRRRISRLLGLPTHPPTAREPRVTVEYDPRDVDGTDLTAISGIGEKRAQTLIEAGITSQAALATATPAPLATRTGMSERRLRRWIDAAAES